MSTKHLDMLGVSAFCESMAMMVHAGIQTDEAIAPSGGYIASTVECGWSESARSTTNSAKNAPLRNGEAFFKEKRNGTGRHAVRAPAGPVNPRSGYLTIFRR